MLERLWQRSPLELSRADRESLADEIRQLAVTTFGLSRVAFSADSVAGALHWLAALDPPVAIRNGTQWRIQRRTKCPPETTVWLLDLLRHQYQAPLQAPLPPAALTSFAIGAMLEPAAVPSVLRDAATAYPGILRLDPTGTPVVARSLAPGVLPEPHAAGGHTMQLASFWAELNALQPILDTVRADDIAANPAAARERYERAVRTYLPLGPVIEVKKILQQRLLKDGKSVTGYIAADYGYGKTAAAAYLWRELDRDEVVAVPPFILRRLNDFVVAVDAWTRSRLATASPHLLPRLDDAKARFSERSLDQLLQQVQEQIGLSGDQAMKVAEMMAPFARVDGGLVASYLHEVTSIVREAGYRGLAVFADELQEYLRTEESAREAIQNISELIKDIRALENTPLCLMLVMPVNPTETTFAQYAGDVVQRMRELGTSLRLEDAYDRTFPTALWNYVTDVAQVPALRAYLPTDTLEALGQLITDKALSNGPRTLINVFKQVAVRARAENRPYTPLDLADDYVNRQIVFDGAGHRITQLLHELLDLPAVRGHRDRETALKLLAMFPDGARREQLGAAYEAVLDLWDQEQFGGKYLTRTSTGYALVGLRHEVATESALDGLLRRFQSDWHYVWSTRDKHERAFAAFVRHGLPKLFPHRTQGAVEGFKVEPLEEGGQRYVKRWRCVGGWQDTIRQFPDRVVGVVVALNEDEAAARAALPPECDVEFRITLRAATPTQPLWITATHGDHRIDLKANLARTLPHQLPFALGMLENLIAPERVSALLLLALANSFDEQLEKQRDMSRQEAEQFREKRDHCVSQALQLLFPDPRHSDDVQVVGIEVEGAGSAARLFGSLLASKCKQRYPTYHPLKTTKEWNANLLKYRQALSSRKLAERRGVEPFRDTKPAVAAAFSLLPSSFPAGSRYFVETGLLEVDAWRGAGPSSEAAVRFVEHPLERFLLELIAREGTSIERLFRGRQISVRGLPRGQLVRAARKLGYLEEEVLAAIDLAKIRQRLDEQNGTICEFGPALDRESLLAEHHQLKTRFDRLAAVFRDELFDHEAKQRLDNAADLLNGDPDEIALDNARTELTRAQEKINDFVDRKAMRFSDQLETQLATFNDLLRNIDFNELEAAIEINTPLAKHLQQHQVRLSSQRNRLRDKIEQAKEDAESRRPSSKEISDIELITLDEVVEEATQRRREIEEEARSLRQSVSNWNRWKELCYRAHLLKSRLRANQAFIRWFESEFEEPALELFATRRQEALAAHNDYAPILARLEEEEHRAREKKKQEWLNRLNKLAEIVREVTPDFRTDRFVYSEEEIDRSNHAVSTAVREALSEVLRQCATRLRATSENILHLEWIRGLSLLDETTAQTSLDTCRRELGTTLATLALLEPEEVEAVVKKLKQLQDELSQLERHLQDLRRQRVPATPDELAVLEVLSAEWHPLEHVAVTMEGTTPLEALMRTLGDLYRKGYLHLHVRRADAEPADNSASSSPGPD
ncbi:MAG: DUF2791 family P-loop domain-containing protein [Candidatus Binatia bacterium]|nr:DUF2791 family P-loop domain-containing protein [Candidatus Binatia bacterium]MDW8252346.1 DUF2791 family P-loop domain-containing protein [Chloroflexota bacterium]